MIFCSGTKKHRVWRFVCWTFFVCFSFEVNKTVRCVCFSSVLTCPQIYQMTAVCLNPGFLCSVALCDPIHKVQLWAYECDVPPPTTGDAAAAADQQGRRQQCNNTDLWPNTLNPAGFVILSFDMSKCETLGTELSVVAAKNRSASLVKTRCTRGSCYLSPSDGRRVRLCSSLNRQRHASERLSPSRLSLHLKTCFIFTYRCLQRKDSYFWLNELTIHTQTCD